MKKEKVVCMGEALIDRIRNKTNHDFTDFLGGAPANVACALKKLKINSVFIGCLGSDKFGKKFIEQFKKLEVDINFLQVDQNFPTRIVKVKRDEFGDRYFSGFDKSSKTIFADEAISKDLIAKDLKSLENLFLETKFFVAGTNILSSSISAEAINYILILAKKFDVKIIIDLNWREVFWNYSTFSSQISQYKRFNLVNNFLKNAHILKLAKEEAILFFDNNNPCEISNKFLNQPDVIITDGGNPISWYINGFIGETKVFNSSKIEDTTGAGDAFLAGLISKLVSSGYPPDELDAHHYFRFASVCGLLTCLGEGAIDQQPYFSEVREFLGSQIL